MTSIYVGLIILTLFVTINKLWCFWCRSKTCLVGKTAIITGGSSGMGFQTALDLASRGCRVIIADIDNTEMAIDQIINKTHNHNVVGKLMDLQHFKSVRAFANDIIATEKQLHILICNAGIGEYADGKMTEDGLHKTMQVNYFGHFLLTHLLIDLLKKSAPSRIIYTSSILAFLSQMQVDDLNPTSTHFLTFYGKITGAAYSGSKLVMSAAIKEFAERLKGTGVTANSVHPGAVKTSFYARLFKNEINIPTIIVGPVIFLYGKNAEEGAQTLIHVAVSDEVKDLTGQSFHEGRIIPQSYLLKPKHFCEKVWHLSIQLTGLREEEIKC